MRLLFYILGILFTSIGLSFCILYLNLLTLGYSFFNLVHFIIRRGECNLFILGILMMFLAWKGKKIHELLLRCFTKF